jgi:polyhydroxyalkanoate synthesis repressor PhaR
LKEPTGVRAAETMTTSAGESRVIKKYANRRLYNTASSSYVTLEHLSDMVKEGVDFVVYDAKTNDDITRSVLTQIIFEEESQGRSEPAADPVPPPADRLLRQLDAGLPAEYLEMSLESFTQQQERCAVSSPASRQAGPAWASTKSRSARTWRCSTGP